MITMMMRNVVNKFYTFLPIWMVYR